MYKLIFKFSVVNVVYLAAGYLLITKLWEFKIFKNKPKNLYANMKGASYIASIRDYHDFRFQF